MSNIWAVMAGGKDRDYSDFFLNYGIVAVGGGDEIKEDVEVGDYILLHRGVRDICGVGRVLGDFQIEKALIDVEGYGLEKTRRVGWAKNYSGEDLEYYLRPQISPVRKNKEKWVSKFEKLDFQTKNDLPNIPQQYDRIGIDEVNVRGDQISSEEIQKKLKETKKLISRYRESKWGGKEQEDFLGEDRPSEMEIVAYIVIPFFKTLGWKQEWMAPEWKKIDLAFFSDIPTEIENCVQILEAKKWHKGLGNAREQAKSYIEEKEMDRCKQFVLSDGERYSIYSRTYDKWELKAYFNLRRIQKRYKLVRNGGFEEIEGIKKALEMLTPESVEI